MSGFQLGVLRRRLATHADAQVVTFDYPTVSGAMAAHARSLIEFAQRQRSEALHLVGHSLGGLVVLRALEVTNDLPPGRAVLLGTPLQGSRSARVVANRVPFGKILLGGAVNEECIDCPPRTWSGRRDVGVIAGSMRLGLGRLFAKLEGDHDGTILVDETRLPGAKDHIVLRTTHTGMLLSDEVARQSACFLAHGQFDR